MAGANTNNTIIMRLAANRGGICTRAELLAAGLSERVVKRRVAQGRFTVIGRGVYLVDELANNQTPLFRAQTLVSSGLLSHKTAASILDLAVEPPDHPNRVDLIVGANIKRNIDGIVLHRRRQMPQPCDMTTVQGLRLTGAARTIVDLAAVVGHARLTHVVQTAIRDNLLTIEELVACFDSVARRGVAGVTNLRSVLRPLLDADPVSQSELELALGRLLTRHKIDGFRRQYRPPWFDGVRGIVDFAHPELGIVLEADGLRWHGRDSDIVEDRRRDRLAAANGWVSIRVTWVEVAQRPGAVAEEIRSVMNARSQEPDAA